MRSGTRCASLGGSVTRGRRHGQVRQSAGSRAARFEVTSILVVDDEPDARYLLRYAFERAGYVVSEAADGSAAIAAIAVSAPNLVVTDMMMPVMDGVELIRRLREDPRTADIPILCVSGNYELAVGADLVLDKFGDLSDLIPLVQALLDKGRDPR